MKRTHRILLNAIALACSTLFTLGASPNLFGQQAAGSITGTVIDPLGAAVADATVTVRDADRGTTWTTRTTAAGLYEFPQIPVGKVEVKAEAPGFSIEARSPFNLGLNQVAQVDFRMKLGKVSETVDVSSAPPLLQTQSTEVGTVLDTNVVNSIPLATRDINQLALLAPGVVSPNIFAFESSQNTFGTGRPYVNGAREQDNNASLDGMDINQPDNNDVAYVASPDAIQERAGGLRELYRRCGG